MKLIKMSVSIANYVFLLRLLGRTSSVQMAHFPLNLIARLQTFPFKISTVDDSFCLRPIQRDVYAVNFVYVIVFRRLLLFCMVQYWMKYINS